MSAPVDPPTPDHSPSPSPSPKMAATSAKPALSALKTPVSATYPSELRSPQVATPSIVKREDGEKTPITPPAAYVDFLKALSPVLMSPLATGTSSKFTFEERPPTSRTSSASSATTLTSSTTNTSSSSSSSSSAAAAATDKPASPATSHASSPPATSDSVKPADAVKSGDASASSDAAKAAPASATEMRVTIPPPSPFVRPMSARTPRLRIPPSPFSAGVRTPLSAHSLHSPYSATMSPGAWSVDGKTKDTRAVSVRQVVTRTVTYSRTPVDTAPVAPLDPAPKGKRRRIK